MRSKPKPRQRFDKFKQWPDEDYLLFNYKAETKLEDKKLQNNRRKKDTVAKEIEKYRNSTQMIIQKRPFHQTVRDIMCKLHFGHLRIQSEAVNALQEASETHICLLFEALNRCAAHGGRTTITPKDMHFFKSLMLLVQAKGFC